MSEKSQLRVRLLFADEGSFHHEEVSIPGGALESYDRLIDWLREDEGVQKVVYVDVGRLCSAVVLEE